MLAQEERVQRGQAEILVGSAFARSETLHGRVSVAARAILSRWQVGLAVRAYA